MRKSGWAAAAGLISAAMLLTACGGSSSSTNGATGGSSSSSTGGSSTNGGGSTPTVNPVSTNSGSSGGSGSSPAPTASAKLTAPPPGTLYFTVQHSAKGWILAEAGKPVYTFSGDKSGQAGTYSGAAWPVVKGQNPQVSSADKIPGSFTVVGGQVLYNGMPLYTYGTKSTVLVHPSSQWKLVPMSSSYIVSS